MFNGFDPNLYAYAWTDPVNYIDSNGKTPGAITIGLGATVVIVTLGYIVKNWPEIKDKLHRKLYENTPDYIKDAFDMKQPPPANDFGGGFGQNLPSGGDRSPASVPGGGGGTCPPKYIQ